MTLLGRRALISRRDLDLGQEEIAASVGVSRSYISKIERGRADGLTLDVVEKLAAALGVSAAYLMGYTDDPLSDVSDGDREDTPEHNKGDDIEEELLDLVQQMDPHQKLQMLWGARILLSGKPPSVE